MRGGVRSAPGAAGRLGPHTRQEETLRFMRRTERLVLQCHVNALDSSARYRTPRFSSKHPDLALLAQGVRINHQRGEEIKTRPKSCGTVLQSLCATSPFLPPALREQSAKLSVAVAAEYTRAVRQVEGRLRRQAGRITQEATRLDHQKEKLEKLLRSIRQALLINQKNIDKRRQRPATETEKDAADNLLCQERNGLKELKQGLETLLRDTLTQLQALAKSSRELLDCAFERSSVIELLPQHGSPSAAVHLSVSPLSLKPDPAGPFTPECKRALDSSAAVLRTSQQLSGRIERVMGEAIIKQAAIHRSVSEGLLKKIAETQSLQQRLTLSSATTRQAIYRKQRQMQCATYSHGRALGPVSSDDLFCRERMNRPVVQVYERHPSLQVPESRLLTQGSMMLKQHLEFAEKAVKDLQVAKLLMDVDSCAKRAAAGVDSAIARLRRRNLPHNLVQSACT
ncbi:coiled-coil domain-containing protein 105 [Clarias gariepinus]|uniref:coiled-coil domain-containing protein 105 n=1 Tax=Clarias gariepinus TaxID=13013 RepID=UPI00234E041A|nr:coiled-coil domain-containing protein 105 [Clarias gariepinus]